MRFESVLEIAAAPERVWQLTIDVESLPHVTPTVTQAMRLDGGDLQVGSRVRVKQPGSPARVWTVTEVFPPRRFSWRARLLGSRLTGTHELVPTGSGTTNILRVDVEGWSAWFVGAVLGRAIRRALATENRGFKAAAEAGEGT